MALYAFDGTWNKDKPGTESDTNVAWFTRAYQEPSFYLKGVGTRFGALGKIVGGIAGAGGRSRVKKARKKLAANFAAGDTVIDIVGFSRGAALALHFANKIESKGVETPEGTVSPRVRFLGLWDTVPSFGAPSVPANIGWDLDLPDNVDNCYHALALDERRHTFKLHRLEARIDDVGSVRRLEEVWFRGVHSDVGGGNKNPGLASLALHWMLTKARQCGLPIDTGVMTENKRRFQPEARISVHEKDLLKQKFRIIRSTDETHSSVTFRNDTRARKHNNPPAGLSVVSDTGRRLRGFRRA
jgi:uncharacterized protein (DUF2235 family)